MGTIVRLVLPPEVAADSDAVRKRAASIMKCSADAISTLRIVRKSVDARKPSIVINLEIEVLTGKDTPEENTFQYKARNVSAAKEVIIVGSGPAGLFAALRLIELGLRPVIIERGRDVSERKKDLARISREHIVDPDSNYCFGEGGAGTYSDGKLYTRSKKRGDNTMVLRLLHLFGADESVLYEAHPHIGTDKLPGIVRNIRQTILDCGGLILFNKRIDRLLISGNRVTGAAAGGEVFNASHVVLATGHSARDIYHLLMSNHITIEAKPFALGVRVEHPQELIDRIQYHGRPAGEYLPPASYTLTRQVNGRGVYSFCMCPGGFIVPSATADGEVVVNGMSPSKRNSRWANSGIVAAIRPEELSEYNQHGSMAGLMFQSSIEKMAWENGGMRQTAPAQRLTDFLSSRQSQTLPASSYFPGLTSSALHAWLPEPVCSALREGFTAFGKLMRGYVTDEAVVVGVESRSSSPVRIPRDTDTLEHIEVAGLYPCGEGSGYAGGIVSSAVDGLRIAEKIAEATNASPKTHTS
ncbi:MAG: FAD-binding protein [Bacteroidetes bacterium]|nr:FAD-binding protein [Bacteroidota bacterium]